MNLLSLKVQGWVSLCFDSQFESTLDIKAVMMKRIVFCNKHNSAELRVTQPSAPLSTPTSGRYTLKKLILSLVYFVQSRASNLFITVIYDVYCYSEKVTTRTYS